MEFQNTIWEGHFRAAIVLLLPLALISSACRTDPVAGRRRLFERAEHYRQKGLIRQAEILYRNAVKLDPKSGVAYYQLGIVQTQRATFGPAIGSLRRAVELLPEGPDRVDARVRLAKLLSIYVESAQLSQPVMEEVERLAVSLLEEQRDEYHGHLFKGSLAALRARRYATLNLSSDAETSLRLARSELLAADAIRPAEPDSALVLARVRSVMGDTKGAEESLRALLAKHPASVVAWHELYNVVSRQPGREAESVLQAAIRSNPTQNSFRTLLAAQYMRQGRREQAAGEMARLKADFRRDPAVFEEAAALYLKFHDPESAIQQYEEGSRVLPRQKVRYQKLAATTLLALGRRQDAALKLAGILSDAPKDVDARVLHAQMRLEDGDLKGATAELEQLAGDGPGNLNLQYNLARVHLANGRYEEARIRLSDALRLSPGHEPSRLLSGEVYLQSGEYLKALIASEGVLSQNPSSVAAQLQRAHALDKLKRFAEARKQLSVILAASPGHPQALYRLAEIEVQDGNLHAAEANYRRSYQASPGDLSGLYSIVEIALARKEGARALDVLRTEARRFPRRTDIRILLGDTAVRLARCDVALPVYKALTGEALEAHTRGLVENRLGLCLLTPAGAPEALVHLKKAQELLPKNSEIHRNLGYVYDLLGRSNDSRASYETSLGLDGENPVTLNNLAFQIAEHGGDLDQALTYAQRAQARAPQQPEIADTIGWIYLKKNLVNEALTLFSALVEKQPAYPEFRYHYAFALMKAGDRNRARTELQAALSGGVTVDLKNRILELLDSGD